MISEVLDRGEEPDASARPVQERHFWRIGSVMVVVFIQTISIGGLDELFKHDMDLFFKIKLKDLMPFVLGIVIIGYSMLVWIGLYTDTVVGKYKMMIFGIALKTAGTCIGFAVILIMKISSDSLSMVSVKVLLVTFLVGLVLFVSGCLAFWPCLITFGLEQVQRPAAATTVRWEMTEFAHIELSVWLVSRHAFLFIVDVLSIIVLCKTKYTITTFEQGKKSLHGLVRVVTTTVLCRRRSDETARILQTREERCRDRLLFKKVLFLIALLSVMAIAQSMAFVLNQIYMSHDHGWAPEVLRHYLPATQSIAAIILIPVLELVGRKLGCQLWQDSAKNQLKMIGIGSLLASLALVMAGAVTTAVRQRGGVENVSPVWAFPQFVTMGVAQAIIGTSMSVFCLIESLPGLTTTTYTLAFNLFVLGPLVEVVVVILKGQDESFSRGDIVLYSTVGAMVVMLVIIYLPLSMSYLKTKSELEALDIETEDEQDGVHVSGDDAQPEGQTLSRLATLSTMSELPTIRNYGSLADFSIADSINKDNLDELFDDE